MTRLPHPTICSGALGHRSRAARFGCGWIEDDEPGPGDEGISRNDSNESDDQPPPDDEGDESVPPNESDE